MSDSTTPPARPKMNPVARILIILAGVAAIVTGIQQMMRGVQEMKADPEVERLAKESDSAFAAANTDLAVAGPQLQSILRAVDKDGLAAVRRDRRAEVEKIIALYEKASGNLRLAAQKADEAAAKAPAGKMMEFYKTKAEACRGFAAARDISRDVGRMVLDESIKTAQELGEKFTEAMQRSKQLEESANAQNSRAEGLK